jgi:RND superfamily putative drug exporter
MAKNSRALPRPGIFPKPQHLAARMGRWSTTHRKLAIFGWLAFVAVAVALGTVVGTNKLTDANAGTGESGRAERIYANAGFKDADFEEVLVQSKRLPARSPQFRAAVDDVLRGLAEIRGIGNLRSPYSPGNADQISPDRRSALVKFEYAGHRIGEPVAAVAKARRAHPGLYIGEVGGASAEKALNDSQGADFKRAELLSIPLTLVILLAAFGALVAAGIPLALALSAVLAASGLLSLVSHAFPADDAANSVILLIGLAVGVDCTAGRAWGDGLPAAHGHAWGFVSSAEPRSRADIRKDAGRLYGRSRARERHGEGR